ncbi:hypothetical protein [Ruegeria lacuscaerulensis]|uniref:hypothetical protein n=1 Tax=Ruegeria lacuscaerulensis TaxID=55218 RepID=UPI00147E408B|nr:hypothetical protein [Ruegeria lacuscaerulensis]
MTDLELNPGDVVLVRAFDDVAEHLFRVEEVFEDCVTGFAVTGPLAGSYGEPALEMIVRLVSTN